MPVLDRTAGDVKDRRLAEAGRALQDAALAAWGGKPSNFDSGQREFHRWARLNGLARSGAFQPGMEQQAA